MSNRIYSPPDVDRSRTAAVLAIPGGIGQAGSMHAERPGSSSRSEWSDPANPSAGPADRAPADQHLDHHPARDQRPDHGGYVRDESLAARLDRNYGELLQELRVAQTGVQILFAFLLTIPFQSAFAALSEFQNDIYLATLISAAVAVVLLIAPVATHRLLFRRRQKDELVRVTARLAGGGLTFLAIAILGAVLLIVDLVSGGVAATIVTAALAVLLVAFWLVFPASLRRRVASGATDVTDGPDGINWPTRGDAADPSNRPNPGDPR
jgi:hypothetical protein